MEGTPRRVGGHSPTHLGVQFKLFWFYYAQRRAGRPRSSPFPHVSAFVQFFSCVVLVLLWLFV
ncbi:MAG: hypothetical protein LBQ66_13385 [Planctomycetaceae bacterium]|nr:hypothetical protein [Planctomycetaceae bacterium]